MLISVTDLLAVGHFRSHFLLYPGVIFFFLFATLPGSLGDTSEGVYDEMEFYYWESLARGNTQISTGMEGGGETTNTRTVPIPDERHHRALLFLA
jgi:hypothetical protein